MVCSYLDLLNLTYALSLPVEHGPQSTCLTAAFGFTAPVWHDATKIVIMNIE